ncbi:MAG: hypothetical protein KatS3mg060_1577 [Dehalococcoidia bacterium]|nr:MAG: hypothetical protein KatS3mg060_1577 [Dehalococcoidia bacterium]
MNVRVMSVVALTCLGVGLVPTAAGRAAPRYDPPTEMVSEQTASKLRVVHHRPGSAIKYGDPVAYAAALDAGHPPHLARGTRAVPHAALMASGVITDPMRGAYLVAPSDQLLVVQAESSSAYNTRFRPYDTDDRLDLISKPQRTSYGLPDFRVAAVAADLDGTAVQSLVTAETPAENCLHLATYSVNSDLSFAPNGVATPCIPNYGNGHVVLAAGYLYDGSTGGEQVVVGVNEGSAICLNLYDGRPPRLTPKGTTCVTYDAEGGQESFDLAVGDLNGDGSEELVVAWTQRGDHRMISIYRVDDNGNFQPTLAAPVQISSSPVRWIEVETADVDGDGNEEIIVQVYHEAPFLHVLRAGSDLTSVATVKTFQFDYSDGGRMVVGRFLPDAGQGIPTTWQIIVFSSGPNLFFWSLFGINPNSLQLDRLKHGTLGLPTLSHSGPEPTSLAFSAAAGTFNLSDDNPQRVKSQFAVAMQLNEGISSQLVVAVGESNDSGELSLKGKKTELFVSGGKPLVVIGDWLGRSIRLGPPTYHFEPEVLQVQAVIYEPPQHVDVFPAPTYTITVNYNPDPNVFSVAGTYVEYNSQTTRTSRQTVSFGNTFQLSNRASALFGNKKAGNYIEFSVRTYGGADFEKSSSEYKTQTFGENVRANTDNVFIATEADYDVWEYPIIRDGRTHGHLVVIRPRKNPLDNGRPCLVNCTVSGGVPTNVPGRSFTVARPDHEPGNLLSWQVGVQATDVLTPIFNSSYMSNQGPNDWYMSYSDIQNTVNSTKWWAGVDITVSGQRSSPPIASAFTFADTFQATYRHDSNTTTETGFDQSTGLKFYYNNPDVAGSAFNVSSLVYWATPFPFLRVNYLLNVPTDPTTLWGSYYGALPDPTMLLRHRARYFTEVEPRLRYLEQFTEDIRFSPAAVAVGETVTITGTIRNYSYAPVTGTLPVIFYRGNPSEGGVPIGQTSLNGLAALSAADVHLKWTPPPGSHGCYPIWMVIDPERTIQEIHRDNNSGFNMLAVFTASQPQQDNPCSGSASSVPAWSPHRRLSAGRCQRNTRNRISRW